jgi:cathepsin F
MKGALILVVIATAAFALHLPNLLHKDVKDPVANQFSSWMAKNNKFYASPEEQEHRFTVYKKNLEIIKWIQANDDSAVYGPTQFADMTAEEFGNQYLNLKVPKLPREDERTHVEIPEALPEEFDWRDYGAVTEVKSQGGCGSCWAFSAGGNLEGQLAIKKSLKDVSISYQQLVDCDDIDSGCAGGFMEWAFQYINQTGGIQSNDDYPYKGVESQCEFDASKVILQVTNYTFFSKDEDEIAAALVATGPLAVALNASFLQFYLFGIFDPIWCSTSLNHGVTTVGYGEAKKPFWIVKNSWGGGWGEKGYFRIARGKGKCGIDQYTISAIIA